jgi:hypothetical protein
MSFIAKYGPQCGELIWSRCDVENTSVRVHIFLDQGLSFKKAKAKAVQAVQTRIDAVRALTEVQFAEAKTADFDCELGDTAFMLDGYDFRGYSFDPKVTFESMQDEVAESLARDISLIGHLTQANYDGVTNVRNLLHRVQ